jgi:hypothetical protein
MMDVGNSVVKRRLYLSRDLYTFLLVRSEHSRRYSAYHDQGRRASLDQHLFLQSHFRAQYGYMPDLIKRERMDSKRQGEEKKL